MRRERHNLSMLTAFTSAPNHVRHPFCKLLIWPRRAPKVNLPVRTQELNSLLFLKSQKSSAHASGAWRHSHPLVTFPIWGFILTSMNDTSSLRAREHLRSCLHLTNPCTKRKVLILTKPKGKIYKTRSLCNYITTWGIPTWKNVEEIKHFLWRPRLSLDSCIHPLPTVKWLCLAFWLGGKSVK